MPETLQINNAATAMEMAEAIFGSGITVTGATFTGATTASGIYTGGDTTSPGVLPSDSGVILSTGNVNNFTAAGNDPNLASNTTTQHGTDGLAELTAMAGSQTFDAAVLTATFIPTGNVLTMQIVFSSEEYLEYVNSGFNDIVAIWVNGKPATLTIGTGDISINNINNLSNENLYVDNPTDAPAGTAYNTEMDGFTVTLTLKAEVIAGVPNTIVFAIADAGDAAYDSNLIIAGDSVQVGLVAEDDVLTLRSGTAQTLSLTDNDFSSTNAVLTVTQINGIPVQPGDTVTLPSGEVITLQPDGSLLVTTVGTPPNQTIFSYEVTDTMGNTDVAFVTLNTIACFTLGTRIDTVDGPRPVEALVPGDLVLTRDHGPQPLRWIGRSLRHARGKDAPVRIAAGTFGPHGDLSLSPNHCILVSSPAVELLTGEAEALSPVKHLVNGDSIAPTPSGRAVLYLHLLFDRHEIIMANGLPCESYLPAVQTMAAYDATAQEALLLRHPELRSRPHASMTPARPLLSKGEARALIAGPAQAA